MCECFLPHEKCLHVVSCERGDWRLAALRQQRCQIFRVTFSSALYERGDLDELLERTRLGQRWEAERVFSVSCVIAPNAEHSVYFC